MHQTQDSLDWSERFDLSHPDSLPAIQARLAQSGVRFKTGVEW